MTHADWRLVFPRLPEDEAILAYVAGHLPLVALVYWLTAHASCRVRAWSRIAFAIFLVLHVGIHKALEENPQYAFDTRLSQSLIYGAGLLGLLYLVAVVVARIREKRAEATPPVNPTP